MDNSHWTKIFDTFSIEGRNLSDRLKLARELDD